MEVKNIDPKVQTYLSSRVMSIAANEMGHDVVMAPCNGCYHNLKKAEHDLAHDAGSREVLAALAGFGHIHFVETASRSGSRPKFKHRLANLIANQLCLTNSRHRPNGR
jgi:hypothetical protein